METIQEIDEKTQVERELNSLLEMTFKMEHELIVALAREEE
jgi:hypothetical protein